MMEQCNVSTPVRTNESRLELVKLCALVRRLREAVLNYASEDSCVNGAMGDSCQCAYCVAMGALEASEEV